jgi:hypothetical protein
VDLPGHALVVGRRSSAITIRRKSSVLFLVWALLLRLWLDWPDLMRQLLPAGFRSQTVKLLSEL